LDVLLVAQIGYLFPTQIRPALQACLLTTFQQILLQAYMDGQNDSPEAYLPEDFPEHLALLRTLYESSGRTPPPGGLSRQVLQDLDHLPEIPSNNIKNLTPNIGDFMQYLEERLNEQSTIALREAVEQKPEWVRLCKYFKHRF
ncbi:MAG TPA: hypothetical protein VKK79_13865, partial [Candidatus Lokiarchaeia archaeon]|nr:hypothetical protein [Candidatus Lokiarchaeia archaeon]